MYSLFYATELSHGYTLCNRNTHVQLKKKGVAPPPGEEEMIKFSLVEFIWIPISCSIATAFFLPGGPQEWMVRQNCAMLVNCIHL